MHKTIILLVASLLLSSAFNVTADEPQVPDLKIPIKVEKKGKLMRNLHTPIASTYYGMFSCICTEVYEDLGEIEVYVTNISTGEFWNSSFDSGRDSHHVIQVSGTSGYYEVEYITESGSVYEGGFLIE